MNLCLGLLLFVGVFSAIQAQYWGYGDGYYDGQSVEDLSGTTAIVYEPRLYEGAFYAQEGEYLRIGRSKKGWGGKKKKKGKKGKKGGWGPQGGWWYVRWPWGIESGTFGDPFPGHSPYGGHGGGHHGGWGGHGGHGGGHHGGHGYGHGGHGGWGGHGYGGHGHGHGGGWGWGHGGGYGGHHGGYGKKGGYYG